VQEHLNSTLTIAGKDTEEKVSEHFKTYIYKMFDD
jgi:hypothetical protein